MKAPQEFTFPEVTSNQINIALTADKLNEVIRFLSEKFPEPKPENVFEKLATNPSCSHTDSYSMNRKIKGKGNQRRCRICRKFFFV